MMDVLQRTFGRLLAEIAHLAQHRRTVAENAQTGRQHQKTQNRQKPGSVIDIVKTQCLKYRKPERPELGNVIGIRFGLLEYGADDGSNGQYGQQADGKAH